MREGWWGYELKDRRVWGTQRNNEQLSYVYTFGYEQITQIMWSNSCFINSDQQYVGY